MKNKQTTLEQLKRKIVPYSCWQDNDGMVWVDKEAVLDMINELFQTEKEQIEHAFDEGGKDMAKGEFGSCPQYNSGKEYFISNYCDI